MDREIAKSVMQTSNSLEIEELELQVKNYDNKIWTYVRSDVIFTAHNVRRWLLAQSCRYQSRHPCCSCIHAHTNLYIGSFDL